jgi:cobalt/nickel transport system permease protein
MLPPVLHSLRAERMRHLGRCRGTLTCTVPVGRSDTVVPLPIPSAGPGPHLDPRWKLAAAAIAVCAVLTFHLLLVALLALFATLTLALAARLPPRWLLARVGAVLLVVSLFALPLPLLLDGPGPVWHPGPLRISAHGAEVALLLVARALTIVTLTLTLLATTPADALMKAAHALGVPGLLVQIGLMTYRYLFVLTDELQRLRIAVRVRGFRNRASRHAYRTIGQIAGTLLVRGHERADRVHHAMRCRGFDGHFRSLTAFHTRPADVAAFLLITGISVGLTLLDRVVF